jgi:hypothetical protein
LYLVALMVVQKFQTSELRLMQAGCRRDAVQVMKLDAQCLAALAGLQSAEDEKHSYYVQVSLPVYRHIGFIKSCRLFIKSRQIVESLSDTCCYFSELSSLLSNLIKTNG